MIIRFDRRLYSPRGVEAAAAAFADIADVSVRSSGDWIEAETKADRTELDEACDGDFEGEFSNQALWETAK